MVRRPALGEAEGTDRSGITYFWSITYVSIIPFVPLKADWIMMLSDAHYGS